MSADATQSRTVSANELPTPGVRTSFAHQDDRREVGRVEQPDRSTRRSVLERGDRRKVGRRYVAALIESRLVDEIVDGRQSGETELGEPAYEDVAGRLAVGPHVESRTGRRLVHTLCSRHRIKVFLPPAHGRFGPFATRT
jgi:hypothetical protein